MSVLVHTSRYSVEYALFDELMDVSHERLPANETGAFEAISCHRSNGMCEVRMMPLLYIRSEAA